MPRGSSGTRCPPVGRTATAALRCCRWRRRLAPLELRPIQALDGAHAAISVVAPKVIEQAFGSLRRGGTLVFVAMPADNNVSLPIFETVLNGLTIRGSIVGTRKDLAEVFALHVQGRTRVIRETRKLEEVNECFEEVEKGDVKARIVFDLR